MAASPPIKIYREGEYIGALHHTEDAAAVCGMVAGTEARLGHQAKWCIFREPQTDTEETIPWAAANSWDAAAAVMCHNMERIRRREKPVLVAPFPWET